MYFFKIVLFMFQGYNRQVRVASRHPVIGAQLHQPTAARHVMALLCFVSLRYVILSITDFIKRLSFLQNILVF